METRYIGALDAGTTSVRFMVFDHEAKVVAQAQKEHRQIFPQQGWVEHDPLEIWANCAEVMRTALSSAGLTGSDIEAIGITNQRETTVIWERATGRPVHNALVWQDTRTDRQCNQWLADGLEPEIAHRSGLPISPYFASSKIRWILDHIDNGMARARRGDLCFGTIDTWLLLQLSADRRHVTDVTNASRTMCMNLETLDWDESLLAALDIPAAILPTIAPSSSADALGMTAADGPLGAQVPICGILGDQQAATVGQACLTPGEAKNTYGTGCFLLLNTGQEIRRSAKGLISTVAYRFDNRPAVYALEGSVAMGGATVQWLRDEMQMIDDAADTEELAASVPDNGGCYLVPAFSGLFSPWWRSDARGVLAGLTRYVTKAHVVRAALEAICFQSRDVLDVMIEEGGVAMPRLNVDGGATANDFLMQLQSDILGIPVVRPVITETTSLGAAYAAGLAIGYWDSEDEVRSGFKVDRVWEPATAAAERDALHANWLKAVDRTLNWVD